MSPARIIWWIGSIACFVIGGAVGTSYGATIGIATGYALLLLNDIRFNTDKEHP